MSAAAAGRRVKSRRAIVLLIAVTCFHYGLAAQSIQLFSELQRVGPFGEIIAADRSPSPREIVSPASARNSWTSIHIAVSVPQGQNYFLYTQANPPGIVTMHLYKEQFVKRGREWIPDTLIPTTSPSFGVIPEANPAIDGQTTRDYLLDIWTPADAEVGRRVRVEVLMKYGTWYVMPFELRIMDAVVQPPQGARTAPLPEIGDPADSAAVQAVAGYLAGAPEWNSSGVPKTVREVLRRNAQQDMALACAQPTPLVWLRAGAQIVNGWTLFPNGAEWYLRIRDALISRPRP
jgi:hypothetical protein